MNPATPHPDHPTALADDDTPRRRTRRPRRRPQGWPPPRRGRRPGCRRLLTALGLGAGTALIVFGVLLFALPAVTG